MIGAAVTIAWMLLMSGEQDWRDITREIAAWCGGFLVGGGILSADEFFRKTWYRK
jgi:hypothetical protein